MVKKMSNAMRLHFRHIAAMYRVMEINGMTEQQYCTFKYNCGLQYLVLVLKATMEASPSPSEMEGSSMSSLRSARVVTPELVMATADFQQMERSAVFWGWWKLQWCERDWQYISGAWQMEAIEGKQGPYSQRMKQDVYGELHNPYVLSKALTPNGAVLEASYAKDLVPGLVRN